MGSGNAGNRNKYILIRQSRCIRRKRRLRQRSRNDAGDVQHNRFTPVMRFVFGPGKHGAVPGNFKRLTRPDVPALSAVTGIFGGQRRTVILNCGVQRNGHGTFGPVGRGRDQYRGGRSGFVNISDLNRLRILAVAEFIHTVGGNGAVPGNDNFRLSVPHIFLTVNHIIGHNLCRTVRQRGFKYQNNIFRGPSCGRFLECQDRCFQCIRRSNI